MSAPHRLKPRSWLFVPGHRPERFAKALASTAHVTIIDLEDAVSPNDKTLARDAVSKWLTTDTRVLIRINGVESPWFEDDLRLCDSPGVIGVMLAKAETTTALERIAERTGPMVAIVPLVETAIGLQHCEALARSRRVTHLAFGSIDFQVDMGMDAGEQELQPYRAQLVLASRLAQIQGPVDGVCTAIHDADLLRAETHSARRAGFSGKLCIHPQQTLVVNECFMPTDEQVNWATRVVAASQQSQGAAVALDGKMIDKPVLLKAEAILAEQATSSSSAK